MINKRFIRNHKPTKETFEEFQQAFLASPPHQHQRRGQHLVNTLFAKRPDLYKLITNTEYDPFYFDNRIDRAWEFIQAKW